MTVELAELRALLLPGLRSQIMQMRAAYPYTKWNDIFIPATPHIWVPKLNLPTALAVGAAAAVIKNPEITRRFWRGWTS